MIISIRVLEGTTIAELIYNECTAMGLLIDKSLNPIKVGPDCYMLYATELNDNCKQYGNCQQKRFYALTGGEQIQIVESPYC